MNNIITVLFIGIVGLLAATTISSCQSATESAATSTTQQIDVNPNGSSELALLMREMHDVAAAAKAEIDQGNVPAITVDFSQLTEATPTKPQMIAFEAFEPLATTYVEAMQALGKATDSTSAAQAHTMVINTCMSCHQVSCKGPIPRIRKLYL